MNSTDRTEDIDSEDRRVVRDILAGNHQEFRLLVDRYTGPLYSLAVRLCRQPEDAEEAVQEIFAKTYHSLHKYKPEYRFFSWLYSIAVNHLRSYHRSRKSRREQDTIQMQLFGDGSALSYTNASPDDQAVQNAAEAAVQSALQLIPRKHREVFVLRHIQQLSSKETARVLAIPENTVKTYLLRSRKKLAEILTGWGWS